MAAVAPARATTAGLSPVSCCRKNPITVKPKMAPERTRRPLSLISAAASRAITRSRSSSVVVSLRACKIQTIPRVTSSMTKIGGARFAMKSMNESSSTTVPTMMLGGSPTRVAVPPTFEAITSTMR